MSYDFVHILVDTRTIPYDNHPMSTRHLSEICIRIFTGIPPRSRVEKLPGALTVPVVGIRALTHDGNLDPSAIEEMQIAGGPRPPQPNLSKDDILLSIRGNMPKCAIVQADFPEPTYASGNLAVIRPDPADVDPAFLWAIMMRISRDVRHPLLTRATTQQLSIRVGSLHKLPVWVPPLADQKRIGEAALALRDAVAAERRALNVGKQTFNAFLEEAVAPHE
jgi:hypothetical protein